MADYSSFKVGSVVYPLTANLTNSLLLDANPALYYALDYFVNMIQLKLGARWDAAVTAAGMPELAGSVVAYSLPYDPGPEVLEQQVKFPLFAIWEESTVEEPKTLTWFHSRAVWKAIYVLPALTAGQKELLHPFLNAAKQVIIDRTVQGHDPGYQSNLAVWDNALTGIEKIRVVASKPGNFLTNGNLYLPTMLLTFDVLMRQESDPSFFEAIAGVDVSQQLGDVPLLDIAIDLT